MQVGKQADMQARMQTRMQTNLQASARTDRERQHQIAMPFLFRELPRPQVYCSLPVRPEAGRLVP
jgi:hypothetical protein